MMYFVTDRLKVKCIFRRKTAILRFERPRPWVLTGNVRCSS